MFDITFFGVRGSTPCSGPSVARHGGNTSCVVVQVPDQEPIICDLGTGVRYFGDDWGDEVPLRATALLTHLHWDHIQGLPFFGPILRDGAELRIVGPPQLEGTLEEALFAAVAPPVFPVGLADLAGNLEIVEVSTGCLRVGRANVTSFPVTHSGPTNGYRIQLGEASMVYISDHQQPIGSDPAPPPAVVEYCRGADVLVHDAQYGLADFAVKGDWGHCTIDFAVEVARAAGVGRLVLFHHDPAHDDNWIDDALDHARRLAGDQFEVIAAFEGLTLRSGSE